ncbi:hypothetical protein A5655_23315 [Mycobacterium sp. 1081908.1]|nr:hypothetical protein A5655_23315 [Mycobacterium sp. 1081908.1]
MGSGELGTKRLKYGDNITSRDRLVLGKLNGLPLRSMLVAYFRGAAGELLVGCSAFRAICIGVKPRSALVHDDVLRFMHQASTNVAHGVPDVIRSVERM